MYILIFVLQRKPHVVKDADGYDPFVYQSVEEAFAFAATNSWIQAAEDAWVLDCETGETFDV